MSFKRFRLHRYELKGGGAVRLSLQDDRCIEVQFSDGRLDKLTLPGVLKHLGTNDIEAFTHLRPHQRHPWHAFLCQISALALSNAGKVLPAGNSRTPYSQLPGAYDESEWRDMLWALAPRAEAWFLVVEDTSKPAFMQPPIPDGTAALKSIKRTPDDLDVIVASKNFDEKTSRITTYEPDHWIYALVSLQGQAAYGGSGNYGGIRQFGGYGTRPGVGIMPSLHWGDQWGRDCRMLLDTLDTIASESEIPWAIETGHRLLWLLPWDGRESVSPETLHPYFLEVCRRVRLASDDDVVLAHTGTSKSGRVSGSALNGVVDDPWIPIVRDGPNAFNSKPTWENMARIILDRSAYKPSLAQIVRSYDRSPVYIRFCELVRGQCSTIEYFERVIPVPVKKTGLLSAPDESTERALTTMINLAKTVKTKVLYPALSILFSGETGEGGGKKKRKQHPLASATTQKMDDSISDRFFDYLWDALPEPGQENDGIERYDPWIGYLRECAGNIFNEAMHGWLHSEVTGFLSAAAAENFIHNAMNKHLPLSAK